MLEVMKEYAWDYHTFMNQPSWILKLAYEKIIAETRLAKRAQESQQSN